jgi:Ca2+/Na+ antiporter
MSIQNLKNKYKFLKKNYFSPKEFIKNEKLQKQWLFVIVIMEFFGYVLRLQKDTALAIVVLFILAGIIIYIIGRYKPFHEAYRKFIIKLENNPRLESNIKMVIVSLILFRLAYFQYYKLICLYGIFSLIFFLLKYRTKKEILTPTEKKFVNFQKVVSSDLNIIHNHWVNDLPLWLRWYRINRTLFFGVLLYTWIFGIPAFDTTTVFQNNVSYLNGVVSEVIIHGGFLFFLNVYVCTYLNIWIVEYANPYTDFIYKSAPAAKAVAFASAPIAAMGYHFGVTNPEINPLPGSLFRDFYQEKVLGFKFNAKCTNATMFQALFPGEPMPVNNAGYIDQFEVARRINNHGSMLTTKMYGDVTPSWAPAKTFTIDLIQPAATKENIADLTLTDGERQKIEELLRKSEEKNKIKVQCSDDMLAINKDILDIINSSKKKII